MFVTIYSLKKLQFLTYFAKYIDILPHLVFVSYKLSQYIVGIQKLQTQPPLQFFAGYVTVKSTKRREGSP